MAFIAFAAAAATIPARGGTFGMPAVSAIPTLAELEYILDRAISVQGFGISSSSTAPRFDEALSFLQSAGARYAGRSVYMWGGESGPWLPFCQRSVTTPRLVRDRNQTCDHLAVLLPSRPLSRAFCSGRGDS